MTKTDLEDEVVSLKAQLSAALALAKKHEDDLKRAQWDARTSQANADYYQKQLAESSQAWAKKYLDLETKSTKALIQLTTAGLDALQTQRKDLIHKGQLAIEQARTDTLADAFAHVVNKLAAH